MKKNLNKIFHFIRFQHKILLVINIMFLLLTIGVTNTSASVYSQNARLYIDLKNVSFEDVLWEIQKQTEFIFLYNSEDIKSINSIDAVFREATVEEILKESLSGTGLKYLVKHKTVVITVDPAYRENRTVPLPVLPKQPEISISGTVTDDEGVTLPGVNIVIQGTTIGTVSDLSGQFTLNVPDEQAILVFSFVGYSTKIIPVGSQRQFSVILMIDTHEFAEFVVIGYGTQLKQSVVGAISQTSSEEIVRSTKGASLADGMQGLMPGVIVIQKTAARGGGRIGEGSDASDILIRGLSTWNNSSPLILVDGIERDMNTIDPQEVETISVLKDASATAVFGVRGANGVILITTKRGREHKPKLSLDVNSTMESLSRLPKSLRSYEALKMRNYAIIQGSPFNPDGWAYFTPDEILEYYRTQQYPEIYSDIDWQELLLKERVWGQRYNMNIRGGTKFVKYFTSIGYLYQDDMIKFNPAFTYNRFNFRSNLDFDITSTTRFSVNLQGIYGTQTEPQRLDGGSYADLWMGIYEKPSDVPYPIYSDGIYGDSYGKYERMGRNPLMAISTRGVSQQSRTEAYIDMAFTQNLDRIVRGLRFTAKLANDSRSVTNGPNTSQGGVMTKWIDPDILEANPQTAADSAQYILFFTPDEDEKHGYYYVEKPYSMGNENSASGLLFRRSHYNAALNYARTFGFNSVTGLALANIDESARGSNFPARRIEYVARTTYGYDGRYLFEMNGSRTGVNKFGPERRFDNFYSVAIGWALSNEAFIKNNIRAINDLKVRYSYGTVGNDRVALESQYPYLTIPTLTNNRNVFGTTDGSFQNSAYTVNYIGTVGNPFIQWEKALKTNFGVDFGFFKNLISGSFEYFTEHRTRMLIPSNRRLNADFVGTRNPPGNIGETEMKGYEIDVKLARDFTHFKPWIRFTHTYALDNVIFAEDGGLVPDYQKLAGHQINQPSVRVQQHVIQNWDELYIGVSQTDKSRYLPGSYRFIDYNGDGIVDGTDAVPYGYPSRPMSTYSASFGLTWKNISFMALFYGTYNVTLPYTMNEYFFNSPLIYPVQRDNAWIPELNQTHDATYRAPWLDARGIDSGTFYLWDGSYLRLKTIELSYRFNPERLKRLNIEGLRLFASGNNLLYWSDLPIDTETSNPTGQYPMSKTINFGFNLEF